MRLSISTEPPWVAASSNTIRVPQLACGRRDFVRGENLEPIYLRETAFKKAKAAGIPVVTWDSDILPKD